MKIVVCYKIVPSDEGVVVNADRSLKFLDNEIEISAYDTNAIEAAVRLAASYENSMIIGLTANGDLVENTKLRKAALSRGLTEVYAVKGEGLGNADPFVTASVLKAAVEKIGFNVIICGEGSGDLYNQQVGNLLGCMLGLPTINKVSKITASDDKIVVERITASGVDVLEVSGPAVLSVTSDINIPRIPSMRDILGAGKKTFTVLNQGDLLQAPTSKTEVLGVASPELSDRRKVIVDGSTDDGLHAFWDNIFRLV